MAQKDTFAAFAKDTLLLYLIMDLIEVAVSPEFMASPDSNINVMPINDHVSIQLNDGDYPLTANSIDIFIASSAGKKSQLEETNYQKSGQVRAKRISPAVMNAMAFSYQTHFKAFCKRICQMFIPTI
jgi:hypothetical protein